MEEIKTLTPRCNWLLVGHKKTCQRAATQSGYCRYHIYRNIIPAPCIECGKGTRSTVNVCKDKNCNYQKLRYKKVKKKKKKMQHLKSFTKRCGGDILQRIPFSVCDVPQFREMLNNETE